MMKEPLRKEIAELIRTGRIQEAFDKLHTAPLGSAQQKTLSILEAEFNALNQEERKGTISFEEKQLRRNRLNDKLLSLLEEPSTARTVDSGNPMRILLILLPLIVVGVGFAIWVWVNPDYACPTFSEEAQNKVLLLPFENVGSQDAKPHAVLKDRISALTLKNNLSTTVAMGEPHENLDLNQAPGLAKQCGANVIIWGKYSSADDSIRLILQYHFLDVPDWTEMGELVALKDVTSIQEGQMLKSLEDCILSLCSIIAIRQGNREITEKWLGKMDEKEEVDRKMLSVLNE